MNSVGNMGGAVAGAVTGWIISRCVHGTASGAPTHELGMEIAWTINFAIFGLAYVIATCLWFFFDSTKSLERGQAISENK